MYKKNSRMKFVRKIYLDTSVINFLFADDSLERKQITIDFFDNFIATGVYRTYISGFVIDEISQTTNQKKKIKLFNECSIKRVLSSLRGIVRLAMCVGMPWQSAGFEIVTRYPEQIASSCLLAMTYGFSLFRPDSFII